MSTVWYDTADPTPQDGFREGTACWVRNAPDRPVDEQLATHPIRAGLYRALFGLEVLDAFRRLPHDGFLDAFEEGSLAPDSLPDAAQILRDDTAEIGDETLDWHCSTQHAPEHVVYRIRVEAAALRPELEALAEFLEGAAGQGLAVEFWL